MFFLCKYYTGLIIGASKFLSLNFYKMVLNAMLVRADGLCITPAIFSRDLTMTLNKPPAKSMSWKISGTHPKAVSEAHPKSRPRTAPACSGTAPACSGAATPKAPAPGPDPMDSSSEAGLSDESSTSPWGVQPVLPVCHCNWMVVVPGPDEHTSTGHYKRERYKEFLDLTDIDTVKTFATFDATASWKQVIVSNFEYLI